MATLTLDYTQRPDGSYVVPWDVTALTWELWSPGRVRYLMRSGSLSEPLDPADARWRGTATFRHFATVGDERNAAAQMSAWMAMLSLPDTILKLPWSVLDESPVQRNAPGPLAPNQGYQSAVTVVADSTLDLCGRYTVRRSAASSIAGGRSEVNVGDWLSAVRRDAEGVVTLQRAVQVLQATALTDDLDQTLDILPDPCLEVGDSIAPKQNMLCKPFLLGDQSIATSWNANQAGPWTIQWVEVIV